jgi:hypothetical protein
MPSQEPTTTLSFMSAGPEKTFPRRQPLIVSLLHRLARPKRPVITKGRIFIPFLGAKTQA